MLRIVTQLPLSEVWNDEGVVSDSKRRRLNGDDITIMLRTDKVRFVVANLVEPLKWVDPSDCFEFWKADVKHRLVESDRFCLDDFPDQYCFVASEWEDSQPRPIILLEMHH